MYKTLKKSFAIDCSGSTLEEIFYHDNVKQILNQKYNKGDDIIIWVHEAKFISYKKYMKINKKR